VAFRLIPRDESFFPLFEQLATGASDCAKQLHALFQRIPISHDTVMSIVAAERDADAVTRGLLAQLERSIVTPFDREDIYQMTDKMDDVYDAIRAAAELAQTHHLSQQVEGVSEFTAVLVEITEATVHVVTRLRSLTDVADEVAKVDALETKGDEVHRRLVGHLYSGAYDALEVLRWTNVVERIEKAVNACEKTARLVQTISIKHA
jgi:uncharacterized protein